SESDWLSGCVGYWLWTIGGPPLLGVFPIIGGVLVAFLLIRGCRDDLPRSFWLLPPLTIFVSREALYPGPEFHDLLMWLILWRTVRSSDLQFSPRWLIALIFLIWANTGSFPILGWVWLSLTLATERIPTLSEYADSTRFRSADHFALLLFALIGGSLTPRGIWTWLDSLVLMVPEAFPSGGVLPDAASRAVRPEFWGFLLMNLVWMVSVFQRKSFRSLRLLECLIVIELAMGNKELLPVLAVWVATRIFSVPASQRIEQNRKPLIAKEKPFIVVLTAIFLVFALVDAAGVWPPFHRRWGIGVSQKLDIRLLDPRLFNPDGPAVGAWTWDRRCAGVIAWMGGNVELADHPQRALLGGRTKQHAGVLRDLRSSHRARYRLEDGTWGGWVDVLNSWNVGLLLAPVEQVGINRALMKTTWQPADLDSPSVPYVTTDDPRFAPFVLETIQQQGFVEFGPWQPTQDVYAGHGWRLDPLAWMGAGIDPEPAVRQSQMFRAMDLPLASLRALRPVGGSLETTELRNEWRTCQFALEAQERITFGQSSLFRRLVLDSFLGAEKQPSVEVTTRNPWREALRHYRNGSLEQALAELPKEDFEADFARGMILLEWGESASADETFQSLTGDEVPNHLRIAASYWHQQISSLLENAK
ncbi:MAG: hypothetical protein KDA80_08785, partial [Planctomycetaceae bacterium]|nr:hypothetical protein [Planctomycetaceae bacterium]